MSTVVHVILSGTAPGVSSEEQFMPVYSGKSLFQACIERNASFAGRQLVIGHNEYYIRARDYFKSTDNRAYFNIIEEDHLTNVYSAAFAAFSAGSEEILLITPSNYMINEEAGYKKGVDKILLIAKEGQIGILSFYSEQAINTIPAMICEGERVKTIEAPTDKEQKDFLSKNKKHIIYSGIICCKADVYLQELKTWAPEVYRIAKDAWDARVAQYVAVDKNIKMPWATIEQVLLTVSDKIKVVIEATAKLQIPTKNNDRKSINGEHSQPEAKGNNQGPKMLGLAL